MRRVLTLGLLAAALAGCGSAKHTVAPKPARPTTGHAARPVSFGHDAILTRAEVQWGGELLGWIGTVEQSAIDPTFALARRCSAALRREVAPPPTRRLERLRRAALRGCREMERGAAAYLRSPSGLSAAGDRAFERGSAIFDEIRTALIVATPTDVDGDRKLRVERGEVEESHVDPFLGRVAGSVVGKPVEAACWSEADWRRLTRRLAVITGRDEHSTIGYAELNDGRVHLSPEICRPLEALVYGHDNVSGDDADLAAAVVGLVHEAIHRVGVANEAVTECRAMQRAEQAARALGVRADDARNLAVTYWEDVYPYQPARYRSPECRDGGRLDLRPASSDWP